MKRLNCLALSLLATSHLCAIFTIDKGKPFPTKNSQAVPKKRGIKRDNTVQAGANPFWMELPALCDALHIDSILDLGCGKASWIKKASLGERVYIGVGAIDKAVEENRIRCGDERHLFLCLDALVDDLPQVDVVLCRKLFDSFEPEQVYQTLHNIKRSGAKFLLAPTSLSSSPFNLSEPLAVIYEDELKNKSFGLWLIDDIDEVQFGQVKRSVVVQDEQKPKVLHLSFHLGCIKEIEYVAKQLGLDLTSWFIFEKGLTDFEGKESGNNVYNMFADRAQRVWDKHKDFFNEFDVIWLSDTAPLCRIFLQNNWKKPLIVWICNRFDYSHQPSDFPDASYNELFRKSMEQDNVFVVSYTPYEWYYALKKGMDIGIHVIKPIGHIDEPKNRFDDDRWSVPKNIAKKDTVIIDPHVNDAQRSYLTEQCKKADIQAYAGVYNGTADIKDFKGVMFWTYQWSNMCLFENLQLGLVHFLPSKKFIHQLNEEKAPTHHVMQFMDRDNTYQFNEWYAPEHKELLVYYDSWADLKDKIEHTDYAAMRSKVLAFADKHEHKMLKRWQKLFGRVYGCLGLTYAS